MLLVVVDYYSLWIKIKQLFKMTSQQTAGKLNELFIVQGTPDEIVCDNAAQLMSAEFQQFLAKFSIAMITSSPHFHQANGAAERAVQTAKRILAQDDSELGLLTYSSTPHSAVDRSARSPRLIVQALECTEYGSV